MIDDGISIRIISGEVNNTRGPVRDIVVDIEYLDVSMASGTGFKHTIKEGYRTFAYVIDGNGNLLDPSSEFMVAYNLFSSALWESQEKGKQIQPSVIWSSGF